MALQPIWVNGQWLPNPAYQQPVQYSYCPHHHHPDPYRPCPHHYYPPQPSGYFPASPIPGHYHSAPTPPSPPSPEKDRLTQWIELRQSQGRTVPKSLLARAARARSGHVPSNSNKENEIIGRPSTPPSRTPPILPIKSIRKRRREEVNPAIQKRPKPSRVDTEEDQEEDDPSPKILTIEDITIPGEVNDGVAIYDTCDEIRAQLRLHLSMPGRTQAAFLRDAVAAMGSFHFGTTISNKSLSDFLKKDGPLEGNTSKVYLAAFCYFEKVRILNGRAKTKKRMENEEIWADKGGIERRKLRNHAWCAAGQRPYRDRWGKMHVR